MLLNGCRIGELAGLTIQTTTKRHVPWISTPLSTDIFQKTKGQKQSLVTELPTSLIEKWKSLTRYWN